MKQGSMEWMQARCGFATGSHAADIEGALKPTKAELESGVRRENAARLQYRYRVLSEILTGNPWQPNYVSDEMRWGSEYEPQAVIAYERATGSMCEETGFLVHPTVARMGGSPDRLVNDDGLIECKCPLTTTHLKWLDAGVVPEEHEPQMSFYMAVTGRRWCDFVSYDPRISDPRLRVFIKRLERNDARIAEIEAAVNQFNTEIAQMMALLSERIGGEIRIPAAQAVKQAAPEAGITDDDINWAMKNL